MRIYLRSVGFCIGSVLAGCGGSRGSEGGTESAELSARAANDWRMSTYDVTGSGNNTQERQLKPSNVGRLEVKWTFDAATAGAPVGPIHAVPVVADGKTYVGSQSGTFYGIGRNGERLWSFDTLPPSALLQPFFGNKAPIQGAAVLPADEDSVLFGDTGGKLYKLNRRTGAEIWHVTVNEHPLGGLFGNALAIAGDLVLVGLSAFETAASFFPGYTCCSHRGGVVAVDLATGATRWRYETIAANTQGTLPPELVTQLGGIETFGPSGGDVWSQPTYDADSKTVYISTGQLFSRAPDGGGPNTFDAIIALNAKTGKPRFVTQLSDSLDVFRFEIANPNPTTGEWVDRDVSDSPKIYRLSNGRKVVAAGQKNGAFHVLDASTGEIIKSSPLIAQATSEGGFQSGGAVAGDTVFQHGLTTASVASAPYDGVVMGIAHNGRSVKWRRSLPASPLLGAVAVANGVLYLQSPFEESLSSPGNPPTWALYALDAASGAVLKRIPFPNRRAINGPAVSRGRVYAGFGSAFDHGITTADANGGVVCLGLPGE